jgi:hypothetical protein
MKPAAARVCRPFPAVRTWLERQRTELEAGEADRVKHDISQLVGENASDFIFDSLHVPPTERVFLRSKEAHDAILEAISDALGV